MAEELPTQNRRGQASSQWIAGQDNRERVVESGPRCHIIVSELTWIVSALISREAPKFMTSDTEQISPGFLVVVVAISRPQDGYVRILFELTLMNGG